MSAIWLQSNKGDTFSFLDPMQGTKLFLWIIRSANFGFKDGSALANMAKNAMGKFYKLFFPEGKHKLTQADIDMVMDILKQSYSDDILSTIFLPQLELEQTHPTFPQPPKLGFVIYAGKIKPFAYCKFLKMLSIIDFNNMSVKEVQALNEQVENFLNQDSRLDRNSTEPLTRLDASKVKEKILRDRNKNHAHQNAKPDAFPVFAEQSFKCLGLVTDKFTELLSLKPKAIQFRMGSHHPASVTICNPGESLESGQFKRSHMSALMAMSFEPIFTFNSVYHNVARLVNREILQNNPEKIHMNHLIRKQHFAILAKLAELYFLIQHIRVPHYVLVADTELKFMQNMLVAFSYGSQNFATSCVYLLSKNKHANKRKTTLLMTHSKIAGITKDSKLLRTIPLKESHGTFLAASSLVKIAQLMTELRFPIHAIYLGCDALSQVAALTSPPTQFEGSLQKYYSTINMHLIELVEPNQGRYRLLVLTKRCNQMSQDI